MAADLARFLEQSGYQQINLDLNGVGHFQVVGTLGSSLLRVLIDTGAAVTLLHLGVARRLGLSLSKLPHKGGGAGGGGLDVYTVQAHPQICLGGVVLRPKALHAMDLSHVNQGLAHRGASAVDAIIGVDVFENQAAVIDYTSKSLFLKA
jgi:hypothetical protein